jgi:signal transduction histidine kinase
LPPHPVDEPIPAWSRGSAPAFFRDAAGLKSLKELAKGRLETLEPGSVMRVWVPRCAAGEDAYSVAITLLEAFGKRWREVPFCVFATDHDEDTLSRARSARYAPQALRAIPAAKLERFFAREDNAVRVKPFVRDLCRFISHDLSRNAPFSRLDFVAARDLLTALPEPARAGVLRSFLAALGPDGVLLDRTGEAAAAPELFAPVGRGKGFSAHPNLRRAPRPTGRKAAAQAARDREGEERLRLLCARVKDAVLVRDAATDRVVSANAAAVHLFGGSLSELLTMRGEELRVAPALVRRAVDERRSEERLCLPHYRRRDGTIFPADSRRMFLMLRGRPCDLWMLRDATARLRSGSHGRREKVEDGLGEVVHELRSPLAVIAGSAETLRKGVRGKSAREEFIKFIEEQARRMGRLVDDLLELSSIGSPARAKKRTSVPLAEAVWDVAAAFVPIAKRRGIGLVIDIPPELSARVDPVDLPQIVGNLLDNALKYTPRGGAVRVDGRVEGKEVLLTFADSGKGIPDADLERVFERFFRGERTARTKGTGLGLAIVRGLVNANRGRVFAANAVGGGTVFTVALPSAASEAS